MPWFRAAFEDIYNAEFPTDHEVVSSKDLIYFEAQNASEAAQFGLQLWQGIYTSEEHSYRQCWRPGAISERVLSSEVLALLEGKTENSLFPIFCAHCGRGHAVAHTPTDLCLLYDELRDDQISAPLIYTEDSRFGAKLEILSRVITNPKTLACGLQYFRFVSI